ncbi:MAG: hypothetical protein HQK53_20410, partial [Oligoflexia bacterium]|nr:hypothetical protein [Oligoflexia bacterium]
KENENTRFFVTFTANGEQTGLQISCKENLKLFGLENSQAVQVTQNPAGRIFFTLPCYGPNQTVPAEDFYHTCLQSLEKIDKNYSIYDFLIQKYHITCPGVSVNTRNICLCRDLHQQMSTIETITLDEMVQPPKTIDPLLQLDHLTSLSFNAKELENNSSFNLLARLVNLKIDGWKFGDIHLPRSIRTLSVENSRIRRSYQIVLPDAGLLPLPAPAEERISLDTTVAFVEDNNPIIPLEMSQEQSNAPAGVLAQEIIHIDGRRNHNCIDSSDTTLFPRLSSSMCKIMLKRKEPDHLLSVIPSDTKWRIKFKFKRFVSADGRNMTVDREGGDPFHVALRKYEDGIDYYYQDGRYQDYRRQKIDHHEPIVLLDGTSITNLWKDLMMNRETVTNRSIEGEIVLESKDNRFFMNEEVEDQNFIKET